MLPSTLNQFFFQQVRKQETGSNRVYEPVIAVVTDNKDPDKLARIKVKYPVLGGEDTSWWAPIVQLGAGEERGWFFLPEVDDEVLVVFEHGDIHRPLVIGALWNGKDAPPETNDGENERRTLMSREGSIITFDDDKGTITLEDGQGEGTIVLSKENKITITAKNGDVCIQAPKGELNIVADKIESEGTQNYHIETKSGTNIGSDGAMTFKSPMLQCVGATVDLNPGGVTDASKVEDSCEEVPDPLGG